MKLSHTTEMAIYGLWELAQTGEERMLISEIAAKHQVSESYLAKIFHKLGKAGMVESRRGKIGGFSLAKPADEINLGQIVRIFESEFDNDTGKAENRRRQALQMIMDHVEASVFNILDKVSLADLKQRFPDSKSPILNRRSYTRREGTV